MKTLGARNKSKGSQFEREICKRLSLWFSYNQRDDLFWRSAMSGGRATVKFKKGGDNLTQVGDISAIDPSGAPLTDRFVIECKNFNNVKLHSILTGISSKGTLIGEYNKLLALAESINKLPMLIMRQKGQFEILVSSAINTYSSPSIIIPDRGIKIFMLNKWIDNEPPEGYGSEYGKRVRRVKR